MNHKKNGGKKRGGEKNHYRTTNALPGSLSDSRIPKEETSEQEKGES